MTEDERSDPSDFTGGTKKSTEDEVEEAGKALESEDEAPSGPFWSIKDRLTPSSASGGGGGDPEPGDYDGGNGDDYEEGGKSRRGFLYALVGLGGIGAGAFAADGADGEVDGNFGIFDGLGGVVPSRQSNQNETTPQETATPVDEQETPYDTPQDTATPEETATPTGQEIYFDSLSDLPDEACYRSGGGVSGYFAADDVENALGESAVSGLTPAGGDIAYDVDFRDSDGDGQGDAYVVQLAGTSSQNDLTVEQAETLFEELDVDGSYC